MQFCHQPRGHGATRRNPGFRRLALVSGWRSRNAPSLSRTNWRWQSVTSTLVEAFAVFAVARGQLRCDDTVTDRRLPRSCPRPRDPLRPVHGQERDEEDSSGDVARNGRHDETEMAPQVAAPSKGR
jgi:hypothetical protein